MEVTLSVLLHLKHLPLVQTIVKKRKIFVISLNRKIEQQQPEQYPEEFGKFETSLERGIQSAGINMSSGDSPRHRGGRPTIGMTLRPESVTEKSFMESMAGFIHEVVPQVTTLVVTVDHTH